VVQLVDKDRNQQTTDVFRVARWSRCFSFALRFPGFGNIIAHNQFKILQSHFERWGIPLPAGDRELVYAPLGTPEADNYLDDMALGANFATVNHLLINALVLEAFQEVIPGVKGNLVYFISHNIARQEIFEEKKGLGASKRRYTSFSRRPFCHFAKRPLRKPATRFLLPGNPVSGSVIMVAEAGADKSCYSVNHGAGRQLGRKAAIRELDQGKIETEFKDADILTNCRTLSSR